MAEGGSGSIILRIPLDKDRQVIETNMLEIR
jgi:hypothetical protein